MINIKNIFFLTLIFLSTTITADEFNKERYKNYKFSPVYTDDKTMATEASKTLNKYLAEWRYMYKLHGSSRWGDKTVFAYTAALKDKFYSNWIEYRKNEISKNKIYDSADWSAVSVFDGDKHITDLNKKVDDLFPNGHFANDYYGCIELKPLFTVKMIEEAPDVLFSITGIGSIMNNLILDRLTLDIYEDVSRSSIQENLFLSNYNPYIENKPNYKFNYYTASNELPEGNPLVKSNTDHRGRKKYAKLFVADFNNDGLLEIIFWHRQYYSTLISDKKNNGFILEKQWFTYYVENRDSKKFNKQKLNIVKAVKYLNDSKLKWKDGFPKNNKICKDDGYSPYKMMPLIIDNEIQNIDAAGSDRGK